MTNKEALSILHCPDAYGGIYSEKYGEALNMAMDALKREPCDDCISRQAVVEQLNVYCKNNCKYTEAEQDVMCRACDTGSCIELIEDAPSVTPARPKSEWIPVSERLPEVGIDVLICNMYGAIYLSHRLSTNSYFDELGNKIKKIRAWMPLPEPYKAESEEQDEDSN